MKLRAAFAQFSDFLPGYTQPRRVGAATSCLNDVVEIDDWAMAPLSEPERRDFWEICEDRHRVRSTILTSQPPFSRWHEQIGGPHGETDSSPAERPAPTSHLGFSFGRTTCKFILAFS